MSRFNNSLLGLVAITAAENPSASVIRNRPTTAKTSNGNSTYSNMTNVDQDKSKNASEAAQIIRNSQVVCFDVDSTVIREEGIDELAKFCGKGQEVARLTKEAMKGSMTFQEALRLRLNIIKPSQKQIRDFLKAHPSTLSTGIKELVHSLRARQIKVCLISGGFDCLIEPVATELGIPVENMFANKLQFYFNGEYAGFDTNQPTSRSGGKGEAINTIRKELADNAYITMVGDGATDLEASPPADSFVGYGGNIVRDEVRNGADYYITDFEKLTQAL
ncbi:phosphoserine phosphatase isoform X2 [Bradysia coprophila]|uniref:phosphoserine phosphatase isoform X2 n=1 Tax=Bradysia coprophila TaxID=38358 RepID=UPI00187DCBD7|nr:phosphoserine phosphatase isoform X2 [Bradysia coprophila]